MSRWWVSSLLVVVLPASSRVHRRPHCSTLRGAHSRQTWEGELWDLVPLLRANKAVRCKGAAASVLLCAACGPFICQLIVWAITSERALCSKGP